MLGVYHPFWLRIGLEVVTGLAVPKSNKTFSGEDVDRREQLLLQVIPIRTYDS